MNVRPGFMSKSGGVLKDSPDLGCTSSVGGVGALGAYLFRHNVVVLVEVPRPYCWKQYIRCGVLQVAGVGHWVQPICCPAEFPLWPVNAGVDWLHPAQELVLGDPPISTLVQTNPGPPAPVSVTFIGASKEPSTRSDQSLAMMVLLTNL